MTTINSNLKDTDCRTISVLCSNIPLFLKSSATILKYHTSDSIKEYQNL